MFLVTTPNYVICSESRRNHFLPSIPIWIKFTKQTKAKAKKPSPFINQNFILYDTVTTLPTGGDVGSEKSDQHATTNP